MSTTSVVAQQPTKALERIGALYKTILSEQIQRIIRMQLLTPAQQKRAKSLMSMDVVKMWARSQTITETRAVIELALLVSLITAAEAIHLRRESGTSSRIGVEGDKPRWDRARGELSLGDQVIRRIGRPAIAKNIVRILDAFQMRRWPARIDDPLPDELDAQRLREAIASLNKGLTVIRFRASDSGVVWGSADLPRN